MGRSKRPDAIPEPQKEKRGRGRPRKANAMSGAQRQASYRARQAANGISVTVTKKDVIDAASHAAVLHERDRLLRKPPVKSWAIPIRRYLASSDAVAARRCASSGVLAIARAHPSDTHVDRDRCSWQSRSGS